VTQPLSAFPPDAADVAPASSPAPTDSRAHAVHRPTNVARTVFHIGSGALALTLLRVLPSRTWLIAAAASFALFAWTCETTRRRSAAVNARLMRFFGPVAHPHEWHRVNSATWYATALLVMSFVVPLEAAELGVIVLALADPAAGIIGRRFGRRRLASGRSLEGALAFAVTGFFAAYVWMTVVGSYAPARLWVAAVAGVIGAATELLVSRVDDNLAIPLGTSLAVALAALAA